jgi:hypothetical protein
MRVSAQNGIQTEIDSLSKIVNDPEVSLPEKIYSMGSLSTLYHIQGDSVNKTKFLEEARDLALRQTDRKYMIYVYYHELYEITRTYPKDTARIYGVIDSIYAEIAHTADREAQALGYQTTGYAKYLLIPGYDFGDIYKSLSIAEKLPDKSPRKYRILTWLYYALTMKTLSAGGENYKNNLQLMLQAAEKAGDRNFICEALSQQLAYTYSRSPEDQSKFLEHFERLEDYISRNGPAIRCDFYAEAVHFLLYLYTHADIPDPDERYKKSIGKYVENCKKISVNNPYFHRGLLNIEILEATTRKDYAKLEELKLQKIADRKANGEHFRIWADFYDLGSFYLTEKRYQQAAEALEKSLSYYVDYTNAQLTEQQTIAEVKFETEKKENELKLARTRNTFLSIIAVLVVCFSIFLTVYFKKRHTRIRLQKENAEQQKENAEQRAQLLQYEKENAEQRALLLQYEKEVTQKRLISSNLRIQKKNEILEKIRKKINDSEIRKLIRTDYASDRDYADYDRVFGEIHPEFFEILQEKAFPQKLTQLELRYCAYIYMNKGNKDIARDLDVSNNTVQSNKNYLKKKLKLGKNITLDAFIQSINVRPLTLPPPELDV